MDGLVERGVAVLDESALTGEPWPVERPPGDRVSSGVVNAGSPFDLRATTRAADSAYAGIVRLVREAQAAAPRSSASPTATPRVPAGHARAGGTGLGVSGDPVRAVAVLVVATPCPLMLAAPVAIVSGLSRAARRGIVVKGGGALEAGRRHDLLMDKTGTLTGGRPDVWTCPAPGGSPTRCCGSPPPSTRCRRTCWPRRSSRPPRARLPLCCPTTWGDGRAACAAGSRGGASRWGGRDGPRPSLPVPWVRDAPAEPARRRTHVFVAVDGPGRRAAPRPVRRTPPRRRRLGSRLDRVVMVTGDRPVWPTGWARRWASTRCSPSGPRRRRWGGPRRGSRRPDDHGRRRPQRRAGARRGVDRRRPRSPRLHRLVGSRRRRPHGRPARPPRPRPSPSPIAPERIALQSVLVGMGLSLACHGGRRRPGAAPTAGALLQELIDVAVILNALRVLMPGRGRTHRAGGADGRTDLAVRRRAHSSAGRRPEGVRDTADRLGRRGRATNSSATSLLFSPTSCSRTKRQRSRTVPGRRAGARRRRPDRDDEPRPPGDRHLVRRIGRLLDESIGTGLPDEARHRRTFSSAG